MQLTDLPQPLQIPIAIGRGVREVEEDFCVKKSSESYMSIISRLEGKNDK